MIASGTSAIPTGTLSQKTHCHEMPSITAPPTSGPLAIAMPPTAPQIPSATPRRAAGNASERIVSVSGITSAPPRPCTARAAMSASIDGASAAAAEATVKSAIPNANMRRRPKRSPSAAPVRRKTAKVRVYAFTVHSSSSIEAPRSTRITGSAVDTTRLSRTTMKRPTEVIASVQSVRALDPVLSNIVLLLPLSLSRY